MDSSNVLENALDSVRLAAEPPPFLSFRTKPPKSEASELLQVGGLSGKESLKDSFVLQSDAATNSTELETQGDDRLNSMSEFYQLRVELMLNTLLWTGLCFGPVWYLYSLNIALNYLLGAFTGIVYLRLLARNVERLGPRQRSVGKSQLAVFVGVIIVASQINGLQVLPVFLGFLTYKVSILVYTLRSFMAEP